MQDRVPGHFYKEELVRAPEVENKNHFFEIEKILRKKKVNDILYYYVKYLFYPSKFNEWICSENMKILT